MYSEEKIFIFLEGEILSSDLFMAEKDLQWGLIGIVVSVFLLMGGLGMSMYTILDEHTSTFLAFIIMAISIYLVAKK